MEQVLGNLTTNACQAMASQSSATGVVSQKNTGTMSQGSTTGVASQSSTTGVKSVSRLTISAACQKEVVAIAVKDTGAGISPENMSRLFEPLFTTRTRGIGLGLAVSRKLAEANGGSIQVQSELGQGSTFTVYLPVAGKGDLNE
jgi:signal transduction histidine kinase